MTDILPKPASRKEQYLAKAAGMDSVTLPDPASREEIYLDAIASGGGGVSDFDELTNRPKYNGVAMTGETDIPTSPSITQTTGSSTTDVMSQDATTKLVYKSPSQMDRIVIGSGASVSSGSTVAIGSSAQANNAVSVALGASSKASHGDSVALGPYAVTSSTGQVSIGTNNSNHGYNNTYYKLLSGVYDGQDGHDAVNVNQINGVIDAINTALSINIPHIGASN